MSIRIKTVLVLWAFAAFCVGVASLVLIRQSQASLENAITDRQLLLTRNHAIALRDNLDLATSELINLSRSAEIDPADGDPAPEQRLLGSAWRRSAFFNRAVHLYTADGVCKWSEPQGAACPDVDVERAGWFRGVLAAREPAFIYVAEADGTGIATLAVSVVSKTGAPTGVLTGTVDLHRDRMFGPALREDVPEATQVVLVSDAGVLLYVSPSADPSGAELAEAVAAVRRGESGVALAPRAGGRHLTAWAPVDYGGLGLVFAWPWSTLDEASELQTRQLMWLTALITLAALLVGWGASRLLVRPLLALSDQIRAAEDDPQQSPEPTERRDEIGELQRAFLRLMTTLAERDRRIRSDRDEIAQLASSLERRVAERSAELQAAQDALLHSERLAGIGQAGALISHELRNSLNAINVGLDLVGAEAVRTKPDLMPVQHQIRAEVNRLRELSDELLSFAKKPHLEKRSTAPESVARLALALNEEHAEAAGVELSAQIESGLAAVSMDPGRIQSALVNLLRNAIDAARDSERTPRRARLVVSGADGGLTFAVEDSGNGVAAAVRERLYQPFVTTKRTGVGLGLATAERFVRAHGGTLRLDRSELGGARFEFRLEQDS